MKNLVKNMYHLPRIQNAEKRGSGCAYEGKGQEGRDINQAELGNRKKKVCRGLSEKNMVI